MQRAIEESQRDQRPNDPNNPDVDRMNYEQLLELGENAGHVNRGYSREQLSSIAEQIWEVGATKDTSCLVCLEDFKPGAKFKNLPCGHVFDAECIDRWLMKEKRCPVCSAVPI